MWFWEGGVRRCLSVGEVVECLGLVLSGGGGDGGWFGLALSGGG